MSKRKRQALTTVFLQICGKSEKQQTLFTQEPDRKIPIPLFLLLPTQSFWTVILADVRNPDSILLQFKGI